MTVPTADPSLPRCVVFDLDGTLVDTAPDLTLATNHVLGLAGRPAVDIATVKDMVGLGARKLIERGLAHTGGGTPEQVEDLLPAFLDFYGRNLCVGSRPFEGVETQLQALREAGIALGVCTNKPVGLSVALIDALGWAGYFGVNLGGDSLEVRKPDPRHLLETIARLGEAPAASVMVGDSPVDVAAARAARVPVVAVSFGFTPVPPAELGADVLIDHYDTLQPALVTANRGRRG